MTSRFDTEEAAERLIVAAAWRVQLTEAGCDATPEFEAWLAGEGNVAAWARVNAPLSLISQYTSESETLAVRAAALTHARMSHVQPQDRKARLHLIGTIAATLFVAISAAGAWNWITSQPDDYSTALGERRVIALHDGSKVSLDSDSEVTVRFFPHARELHLLKGQARFDVAHDPQRPFSVVARDQTVIATGTAFNIDLAGPRVLVTLIEGHVIVLKVRSSQKFLASASVNKVQQVELRAGQELDSPADGMPIVEATNIQRVTAWTSGQLMFQDEPLKDVVARVNRYAETPIEIDDPKVASMKISGVFNTGDVGGFVQIITKFLPLSVENVGGEIHLRQKS